MLIQRTLDGQRELKTIRACLNPADARQTGSPQQMDNEAAASWMKAARLKLGVGDALL